MSVSVLSAAARVPKPWKNGGGITRDVIAMPEGAGMEDFLWRVSIADVASDGPFSTFPGIDRIIAILSGEGIRLDVAGQTPAILTPASAPHAFPGDAPTHGTLIAGPITDLNLMTRRGACSATMRRIETGVPVDLPVKTASLILWQSGAGHLTFAGETARPDPFDAFHAAEPGLWRVAPHGPIRLYLIEIA